MKEQRFLVTLLGHTAEACLTYEVREGWAVSSLRVSEDLKGLKKIFPRVPQRLELELRSSVSQKALEKLFAGEAAGVLYEGFCYEERIHDQTKVWREEHGRLSDDRGQALLLPERWTDLPTLLRCFNEIRTTSPDWKLLLGRKLYGLRIDGTFGEIKVVVQDKTITVQADTSGVVSLEYKVMPFVQLQVRRKD